MASATNDTSDPKEYRRRIPSLPFPTNSANQSCYATRPPAALTGWTAWIGRTAVESSELAAMHTRQWQQLNQVRQLLDEQISAVEQEMAGFLVKTPYVLLLSVTGINVVSAARLAGEAGPIEHYASAG